MAKLEYTEFTEDPSVYTICSNPDSNTGVSCVIVEDDPGPYLHFLSEIATARSCRLVMTAPFAASTLRLLQGEEVVFGTGAREAKVSIPDLARCVVILDMRNETPQSFPGYDPKRFDMAGYQFFLQLRGFPGKVFFATRYGRAKFDEMGIFGPFGVVPLSFKAGFHKILPEDDKQKIQGALDNALILCDMPNINTIVIDGAGCRITFKGEVSTVPANAQERAFLELIKDGGKGLGDEALCERIGYRPRRGDADEKEGGIDRDELDGFGQSDDRGQADTISAEERQAAREGYVSVKAALAGIKSEIRAIEEKLQKARDARDKVLADCKKKIVSLFGGNLPDPRDLVEEDQEKLDELRDEAEDRIRDVARAIEKFENELEEKRELEKQARKTRDEFYRRGYKSRKSQTGAYVVPRESSKPADYARKLKDRLIEDLRNPKYCKPAPAALIAHIKETIVRIEGVNKYIGKEVWRT